uniref:Uncharacterized protein n=1 Tax=Ananas comosus var. bracteatus TaxID=296719 RepID=A0A6V7NGU6_ANACO|nr:unnamed protein product [Ananas comosus var. bracteatus]
MADLSGYRCLIAVNHLSDIPVNLEITFGDLSKSVLIQLERWARADADGGGNPNNERTDQHIPERSSDVDCHTAGTARGRRSSDCADFNSDASWNSSEIRDRRCAARPTDNWRRRVPFARSETAQPSPAHPSTRVPATVTSQAGDGGHASIVVISGKLPSRTSLAGGCDVTTGIISGSGAVLISNSNPSPTGLSIPMFGGICILLGNRGLFYLELPPPFSKPPRNTFELVTVLLGIGSDTLSLFVPSTRNGFGPPLASFGWGRFYPDHLGPARSFGLGSVASPNQFTSNLGGFGPVESQNLTCFGPATILNPICIGLGSDDHTNPFLFGDVGSACACHRWLRSVESPISTSVGLCGFGPLENLYSTYFGPSTILNPTWHKLVLDDLYSRDPSTATSNAPTSLLGPGLNLFARSDAVQSAPATLMTGAPPTVTSQAGHGDNVTIGVSSGKLSSRASPVGGGKVTTGIILGGCPLAAVKATTPYGPSPCDDNITPFPVRSSARLLNQSPSSALRKAMHRKVRLLGDEMVGPGATTRKWTRKKVKAKSLLCGVNLSDADAKDFNDFLCGKV